MPLRRIEIEWHDSWEYCMRFYLGPKLVFLLYSQTINTKAISDWLKFGIKTL